MHLIVHAGPPKTGSSALQGALYRNRAALNRHGLDYYTPARPAEWALCSVFTEPANRSLPAVLGERFASVAEWIAWSTAEWTRFETFLDATRADAVVISSEHFAGMADKAGFLARLSARATRITVVAYVRDPVDVFVSETDQAVRGGRPFSALKGPVDFRYAMGAIRRFEPLLPADGLILRRFDPRWLVGGEIVGDFFALLSGIAGRTITPESPGLRANESLPGAATLWLMSANALGPFRGLQGEARKRLIAALGADPGLRALPRLTMTDPVIDTAIRLAASPILTWLNTDRLPPEQRLKTAPPGTPMPGADDLGQRMRDWLMGYGAGDALRQVIAVASRFDPAG